MQQDIKRVASLLMKTGIDTIPAINYRKKRKPYFKDSNLKLKRNISKLAWKRWKDSGGPRTGAVFEAMRQAIERCEGACKVM